MPLIILVAGGSGAGKTTLAYELEKALGRSITRLSLERYYLGIEEMKRRGLDDNFNHPQALDWDRLIEDVKKIKKSKSGGKVEVPVYSFDTMQRTGSERIVVRDVIVVEGLWALLRKELRELGDLKVYLDVDPELRLVRKIKRDIEERGRELEEILERFVRYTKPMHEIWVEPTKRFADIIIPRGGKNKKGVELVVSWIRKIRAPGGI